MANEDKCTNAQKPSAQHSEFQRATSILIAVLMRQAEAPLRVLEACQVAANEDKCTNAQKPSAQHSEIQRAASILIAALMRQAAAPLRVLEACQEDACFSLLKERFSHLKVTEKIRRALDDRKLAPTPKPLASTTAKLTRFETKNAASAPKAMSAPRSACDFRRGNGPLRGGFRGGGDRRGA